MKLIDLLVQELPKRGGWPEGAVECQRFVDEATIDFYDENGNWDDDCSLTYGPIASQLIRKQTFPCEGEQVTRKQYESALAASQKPAWSGEGIPPVGCECEVSVDGGRSWCTYRAINEKNGVRLVEIGNLTEEFEDDNWIFRPLPTESERKRDAFINAVLDDMRVIPCDLSLRDEVAVIYDAIAAGKIPGVRLDD